MATARAITGLNCPQCGSQVAVPEGQRIVACNACGLRSYVAGESGVYRYQVARSVAREQAESLMRGFFNGLNRAPDLSQKAELRELFLVYLPFWRVHAHVTGWAFGREMRGSGKSRRSVPVERQLQEELTWNDAACEVAEFGVQAVGLDGLRLAPYDPEALRAEGMVFEPVESATEARQEAYAFFETRVRAKLGLSTSYFERFHYLNEELALVFYPLWVARYSYRGRVYQVVIDGAQARVLFGKAPGNVFYRAAMLVAGLWAGNFVLVNGTLLALQLVAGSSDDGLELVCLPPVIGAAIVFAGYQLFRYGEEIVHRDAAITQAAATKQALPAMRAVTRLFNDPTSVQNLEALGKLLSDSSGGKRA